MARDIDRALAFMRACGVDPEAFRTVELYSSHEALLLDYERALTRIDSRTGCRTTCPATSSGWGSGPATSTGRTSTSRPRIAQPDRRQARPDHDAGRGARAGRAARPRRRARPAHVHHPDGRADRVRDALPALVEKVTASGATGRLGLRPDARQHVRGAGRAARPGASTTSSTRCAASSRCTARWARTRAACTSSSPATTSPSASAAPAASARPTCRCATRPPATRG